MSERIIEKISHPINIPTNDAGLAQHGSKRPEPIADIREGDEGGERRSAGAGEGDGIGGGISENIPGIGIIKGSARADVPTFHSCERDGSASATGGSIRTTHPTGGEDFAIRREAATAIKPASIGDSATADKIRIAGQPSTTPAIDPSRRASGAGCGTGPAHDKPSNDAQKSESE